MVGNSKPPQRGVDVHRLHYCIPRSAIVTCVVVPREYPPKSGISWHLIPLLLWPCWEPATIRDDVHQVAWTLRASGLPGRRGGRTFCLSLNKDMELIAAPLNGLDLDPLEQRQYRRLPLPAGRPRRQLVVGKQQLLCRCKGVHGHRRLPCLGVHKWLQGLPKAVGLAAALLLAAALVGCHLLQRVWVVVEVGLVEAVDVAVVQEKHWVKRSQEDGAHGPSHGDVNAVVRGLDAGTAWPLGGAGMQPVLVLLQGHLRQQRHLCSTKR
mmetsp:Transcript_29236/g.82503  ORF Transcript_29236/g.82503 Transcript_29236/m.82503 type:complete len:266 (-) Transcript_29236:191-988(-)